MKKGKSIKLTARMGLRLLAVLLLAGTTICATAAYVTGSGGDKKKDAHKANTPVVFSNLRNTVPLSLKIGFQFDFQFKGNYDQHQDQGSIQSLMTYQKGNTIYILPYKTNLFVSRFKTPERILH